MRSPSQRWRPSSEEWTPPRLVAFTISAVAVSTASASVDVERDQAAVARVAHALDRGVGLEPPGELGRGLRVPPHPRLERRETAEQRARRVGRRGDAAFTAHRFRRSACSLARDRGAEERVVLAGQELRRRMEDDVGAPLQRLEVDGRRDGRVADDEAAVARSAVPSRAASASGWRAPRPRRCRRRAAGRSGRTRRTRCRSRASSPKSLLVPKYAPSAIAMRVPARANASSTFVTAPMPDA